MPSCSQLKQKHKHKQKYKKYCNLPHKQKYTNLRSYHHQPSCLTANRLLRPQHPSASFLSSVEINRKSSPRPLFISSTVPRAWHPVEPMSTTSPGPVAHQRTQVPRRTRPELDFSGSCWPPGLWPKPAAEWQEQLTPRQRIARFDLVRNCLN